MHLVLAPFTEIEGHVRGENLGVAVGCGEVGALLVEVDEEGLALPTCLHETISNELHRLFCRTSSIYHLHVGEIEITQEALILEECVDLIGLVPYKQVFPGVARLRHLVEQIGNAKNRPLARL